MTEFLSRFFLRFEELTRVILIFHSSLALDMFFNSFAVASPGDCHTFFAPFY